MPLVSYNIIKRGEWHSPGVQGHDSVSSRNNRGRRIIMFMGVLTCCSSFKLLMSNINDIIMGEYKSGKWIYLVKDIIRV